MARFHSWSHRLEFNSLADLAWVAMAHAKVAITPTLRMHVGVTEAIVVHTQVRMALQELLAYGFYWESRLEALQLECMTVAVNVPEDDEKALETTNTMLRSLDMDEDDAPLPSLASAARAAPSDPADDEKPEDDGELESLLYGRLADWIDEAMTQSEREALDRYESLIDEEAAEVKTTLNEQTNEIVIEDAEDEETALRRYVDLSAPENAHRLDLYPIKSWSMDNFVHDCSILFYLARVRKAVYDGHTVVCDPTTLLHPTDKRRVLGRVGRFTKIEISEFTSNQALALFFRLNTPAGALERYMAKRGTDQSRVAPIHVISKECGSLTVVALTNKFSEEPHIIIERGDVSLVKDAWVLTLWSRQLMAFDHVNFLQDAVFMLSDISHRNEEFFRLEKYGALRTPIIFYMDKIFWVSAVLPRAKRDADPTKLRERWRCPDAATAVAVWIRLMETRHGGIASNGVKITERMNFLSS